MPWRNTHVKRPTDSSGHGSSSEALVDAKFCKDFPLLLTYLTDGRWEDGSARILSTISLSVEDGRWKLCLNDKDLRRSLYFTGDTLQDVFRSVEKALGGSSADWRKWNAQTKQRGR